MPWRSWEIVGVASVLLSVELVETRRGRPRKDWHKTEVAPVRGTVVGRQAELVVVVIEELSTSGCVPWKVMVSLLVTMSTP